MRLHNLAPVIRQCFGGGSLLKRRGFIFLLSHMRAYTSVLSHVIGSHPDVSGYAETHQRLRRVVDLVELSSKVQNSSDKVVANRFVFDKILHNDLIRERILDREDVQVIVMVRRPQPTLASILRIASGGNATIDQACAYYRSRLAQIRRELARRQGRVCYIDSSVITRDTENGLRMLSGYLGLKPELTDRYQLFRHTGRPKWGDPSAIIKSGVIIRSQGECGQGPDYSGIELFAAAQRDYEAFHAYAIETSELSILAQTPT